MVLEPKETAQALLGCSPPSDLPAMENRSDEPGLAHQLGLGENLFVFQISEAKLGAPRESLFSVGRAGTCDKQADSGPPESCGLKAVTREAAAWALRWLSTPILPPL